MALDALEAAGLASGTLEQACAALGAAGRPSTPVAARAMLAAAAADGALRFSNDTFTSTLPAATGPAADAEPLPAPGGQSDEAGQLLDDETTSHPLRLVSFDLESAARARIEDGGAVSRDVWEIGACRFGPDRDWVEQNSTMRLYVTMREGFTVFGSRADEHAEQQVPAEHAWMRLRAFAADADMIVAYNGTGLDFPLLTDALEQYRLEPLEAELVDVLYLAHCLWPDAPSHTLSDICGHTAVRRQGRAHNALADARNLASLVEAAAALWWRADGDLLELIASITPDSAAWRMLRTLAEPDVAQPAREQSPAQVMRVLTELMRSLPLRRGRAVVPLAVPNEVRDSDGVVTPFALAQRLHGSHVEERTSQRQVAQALLNAAQTGQPVMIEAPTGTGKSLSALASALEWVDRDPQHKTIIATHTKQLQGQLAQEIEQLGAAVPGLLATSDLVKGAANRLSLRGLVYTLADASGSNVGAAGHLIRHTADAGYRELLAFLTLRLVCDQTAPSYRWAAASVDKVDLPPFFLDYCGQPLPAWLTSLAQSTHGEYRDVQQFSLAAWTDEVRDALAGHRVIVANHALLLSHWEEIAGHADDLLLIVDEAHALEGAATDALSPELSTADVDDMLGSLTTLARDLRGATSVAVLIDRLDELSMWWRDARLRTLVAHTLDRTVGSAGAREGSRALTLASPHTSEHPARDARAVGRLLSQLHGLAGRVAGALGQLERDNAGALDPFDEQRLQAAAFRVGALSGTCDAMSATLDSLLNPPPPTAAGDHHPDADSDPDPGNDADANTNPGSATASDSGQDTDESDAVLRADEEADAEAEDPDDEAAAREQLDPSAEDAPEQQAAEQDDAGADATTNQTVPQQVAPGQSAATPAAPAPPPASDRVVYVREDGPIGTRGIAQYRFTLRSSPVRLPLDPDWQALLASFRRLGLMSATLQVHTPGKDSWAYARSRLGLTDAHIEVVTGPFNYREQARLVAFEDFPSWAEQPKQAMRSVAHQLRGYAQHVPIRLQHDTDSNGDDAAGQDGGRGGAVMGGAMVLTTSKNAAAGIAHELTQQLAAVDLPIPVHHQTYLGTGRAVQKFTADESDSGGFLVGTRGLWTGVDVSQPGRMHLVWINKLPFPVFTDPVIAARKEQVRRQAENDGAADPDLVANSEYYLPLAALDLRQAVGRLVRNSHSRGVIIISDRKLGGQLPLRRLYREIFLGSLDPGLHRADPDTGEAVGGNVMRMTEGWELIWNFLAEQGLLHAPDQSRPDTAGQAELAAQLCQPDALEEHTVLPATLQVRRLALTAEQVETERQNGTLEQTVLDRATEAASLLSGRPVELRTEQRTAIAAAARGDDVLALLPTGYGKSYCFQLPALLLPGLTVVISPLVSLMHNQAVNLNGTIGGAVRALVGSLPESSSRAGRTEVVEQMTDPDCAHGIRIVYVSPERLSQARFRDALTAGVAAGIIRRIAIDEAHTYVQWGEDFRPSFRRAGALLRRLRGQHPDTLTLITLTATATPTVEEGLREEVLAGLLNAPARPGFAPDQHAHTRTLTTVRVNPIRPELQLARRALRSRGPYGMSALAEQVVDAADGHVILYCLTIKEVDRLHAHLRDYLDGRPVLLRKFHGRMSEVEKASVSNEFVEAAAVGEDGYAQMIVVATSAFGLGIDRDDIRTVLCVSPPTDLAALYQQLGRGGRDVAGHPVDELDTATYALALATSRTLDTAQWLASLDLEPRLLERFGRVVLRAAVRGYLDPTGTVGALLQAEVAAGRMTEAAAREPRQREAWRTGLVRAVAALADLDAVVDHGDLPERVALTDGTAPPVEPLHLAVHEVLANLPARDAAVCTSSLRLRELHALLRSDPRSADLYTAQVEHTAQLWLLLCDMHDASVLDVSQRPNQRMLTGLSLHQALTGDAATDDVQAGEDGAGLAEGVQLPDGFAARVAGKTARATREAQYLRSFFAPGSTCLNELLAGYFGVDVPDGCCSTELTACSVCRRRASGYGPPTEGPVAALESPRLRPAGFDPAVRAARVDDTVVALLRGVFNGATRLAIRHTLRGDTKIWSPTKNRYFQLDAGLRDAPQRGHLPDLTDSELGASIDRLVAAGRIVPDGPVYRTARNAAAGPRRLRRRPGATPAAAATVAGAP